MMKVSIIIPTYNSRFLKRAVLSVLGQSFSNLEIIIIDDGSDKVNNQVLLEKLQKKNLSKPIRYFRVKHTGLPAVLRNTGIKRSQGGLIAFLDDDDYWLKSKLKIQIAFLEKHSNIDLVCSQAYITGSKKRLHQALPQGNLFFKDLLYTNWVINSSILAKKDLFDRLGPLNENPLLKAYEDYEYWLRTLASGKKIYCLSQPLLYYTLNPKGLSSKIPFSQDQQKRQLAIEQAGYYGR